VKLVSFQFFEDEIFPPYQNAPRAFELKVFKGEKFPGFFGTIARALDEIDGDAIYAIKPRLTSFGIGLLAAALRKRPLILEINDLETEIEKPSQGKKFSTGPATVTENIKGQDLVLPASSKWTHVLDPVASSYPSLTTHNRNLNHRYGQRATFLQNIKDPFLYSPRNMDRAALREELGIGVEEKVLLFGGMVRKHKGLTELINACQGMIEESVAVRLLVVSSRATPDLRSIEKHAPGFVQFFESQNEVRMAQLNLLADWVVLWLDPKVPASHFQMPYKLTDALAMGTPVLANAISDLGEYGNQGYLTIVPFGDLGRLRREIESKKPQGEKEKAPRILFERRFSYPAARASFNLALYRAMHEVDRSHELALDFQELFERFRGSFGLPKRLI
jgi:glycosyltransferase involved in cell wall biosynthesis